MNKIIYICSPDLEDKEKNIEYIRELMKQAIDHDFVPVSPYLNFEQVFEDGEEIDMELKFKLLSGCQYILVGNKYGVSEEMQREINLAKKLNLVRTRLSE